jgi:NADH-quinone oxidoreductase subunit J
MMSLGFGVVAALLLVSSLATVFTKDLIRAVYWLALALLATAALYMLLDSGFLAGVQVLTYVGGVVTLMIFGVMVTRRVDGAPIPTLAAGGFRAAVVALGAFAAMTSAIVTSDLEAGASPAAATHLTTNALAKTLLDEYLLTFEAASLLLLAAIVGAVVLARRKDLEGAPASAAARRVES